ncbi:acetolactate decarboxylase [Terrilactibacillus sp. BCM23-1]|uniref:Alpha-acetolactate decarboxylase n=1 Tax=Terrilactibacillus tamarindi TaxID=2599694 RepID=A0A6N8CNJ2_9BACI|nr:acetolactate decarboxylase [Terrilactibacillus tamarindi]MTT30777.1 acetolactate decarboxylase [Terrilactibacillus tamarindi]
MSTSVKHDQTTNVLKKSYDTVYQVSTMLSLLDGVYEGETTFGDLKHHGDFGIGTFDRLDGELIGFDNEFYRVRGDGTATPLVDADRSPFCSMTYFKPEITHKVEQTMSKREIEELIMDLVPSENLFYAVRFDGVFKQVKTRTVVYQEKPYVPMSEAVESQPIFTFNNVKGTMVGFWTPMYAHGIAVGGFHLHFIDENRTSGGHVFDYAIDNCTIQINKKPEMKLHLPQDEGFLNANLNRPEMEAEMKKTEG